MDGHPLVDGRSIVGGVTQPSDIAMACTVRAWRTARPRRWEADRTANARDPAMSQSVSQTDDLERMRMDTFTGGTAADLRECTHADGCGRGGYAS